MGPLLSSPPQSAYKFEYDADFNYNNPICSYMSPDELVKKKFDGGLHLATHNHYRKPLRVPAASKAACPDPVPNNFNDTTATSS